jgi:hypothetical protein
MEHILKNLLKLGGSLCNGPQRLRKKNLVYKIDIFRIISPFSGVQSILYNDLELGRAWRPLFIIKEKIIQLMWEWLKSLVKLRVKPPTKLQEELSREEATTLTDSEGRSRTTAPQHVPKVHHTRQRNYPVRLEFKKK